MYCARGGEPRSWAIKAGSALICCMLVSIFGCSNNDDPTATAPMTPLVDPATQEFDLVLDAGDAATWPAGASDATEALQMAVDTGGSILLCGTFDLGETGQILIGQMGCPVTLVGDGTAESGRPATQVLGGERSFLFVAPVNAEVRNLWFDGYVYSGIEVLYIEDLVVIEGNTFTGGRLGPDPNTGRSEVWSVLIYEAEPGVSGMSGTVRATGNTVENNEYPVGAWYGPGLYGGGIACAVGVPGSEPLLDVYITDNFCENPGMLGGVVVNAAWGARVTATDNVIHQMPNWNYSGMYVAVTPAPVVARNVVTYAWIYGMRTSAINGAVIEGNTVHAYDTVNPDACWAISVAITPAYGNNEDITIRRNVLQGAMDRGVSLVGNSCTVKQNDFREATPGSPASMLFSLASYDDPTYGAFDSRGNQIKNNHFPEVEEGTGWVFGVYQAGVPPFVAEPKDNMFVGGNTAPTAVFFDDTDTNPDPDVYEGLNRIIFPSFWKGTTPEHVHQGGQDWMNGGPEPE